jgi:hypothetical protein
MTTFLALLILLLISNQQEGEPASLPTQPPKKSHQDSSWLALPPSLCLMVGGRSSAQRLAKPP